MNNSAVKSLISRHAEASRSAGADLNVLHAPVNIGSHPASLANAENVLRRRWGSPARSWSIDYQPRSRFSSADEVFPMPRGLAGTIHCSIKPFLYGLRHVRGFQVLHLYAGKTLLRFERRLDGFGRLDLPLWKALGKRIFMTFQGCDVRVRHLLADRAFSPCRSGVCNLPYCDATYQKRKRRWVRDLTRWADKLFCVNPDGLQFVPGAEFLPYAVLPPDLLQPSQPARNSPPRIVHAPTNRSIKGTSELLAVSKQLQASHPHELRLVEDFARDDALRVYAEADILVDQLCLGWYGGLAVEAMALGLPVVAYLHDHDLARIPPQMRAELPIVNASPESLPGALAQLLEDPGLRRELSRRGPAFVRRWHHPLKIARRMFDLYADPQQSFWEGYDPDDDRRPAVAETIQAGGNQGPC